MQANLTQLRQLRDELRVRIHLAGMDARDEWNKLEPKIEEAEKIAKDATTGAADMVRDVVKRLQRLNQQV